MTTAQFTIGIVAIVGGVFFAAPLKAQSNATDKAEALKWCRKAAEMGNADAIATLCFSNNSVPHQNSPADFVLKQPYYLECRSNSVMIVPGFIEITWEELLQPTNTVTVFLDGIQQRNKEAYVTIVAHPGSVKLFRRIRQMISMHSIDVGYDVVDDDSPLDWDRMNHQLMVHGKPPAAHSPSMAHTMDKHPVFFECRSGQIFFVNKLDLDQRTEMALSTFTPEMRNKNPAGFVKAISGIEIGNEYYTVIPSYLLAMVMALEPKPGVKGDDTHSIGEPGSKFQGWLKTFDVRNDYLVFLVRSDSFDIFQQARNEVEKIGYSTGWEMLDQNEPIKFGTSGMTAVPTQ